MPVGMYSSYAPQQLLKQPQVTPSGLDPPLYAKTLFKLVALCSSSTSSGTRQPAVCSLFRADSSYELDQSYQQVEAHEIGGALLGFQTATDAVLKEDRGACRGIDRDSIRIARFKAWNLRVSSIPRKHGYKLAYDYVRVVELLRVPEKLRQALEPAPARQGGSCPPHLAAALRSSAAAAGGAAEQDSTEAATLTLAQHETANLQQSVEAAEARLRSSAGLGLVAREGGARRPLNQVDATAPAGDPPATAVTLYMLVGVARRGRACPLADTGTAYDMGTCYRQVGVSADEGALHGWSSVQGAVRYETAGHVERCKLPVAVAELKAWNLGMRGGPVTHPPSKRVGLDFARIERILTVPEELTAGVPCALWHQGSQ